MLSIDTRLPAAAPAAAPAKYAATFTARCPRAVVDSLDDDDLDDDDLDNYFATYRPLSNLPTPPPSSRSSSVFESLPADTSETLEASLFGPAVHLVNMLPPAASLATPSVAVVQAMLTRAALPLDTVALAVCVLDALDVRFSRTWRLTCPLEAAAAARPLAHPSSAVAGKRHTLPAAFALGHDVRAPSLHIDAVAPEIIILAALVIAAKFTDDGAAGQQAAHAYCAVWGGVASTESDSQSTSTTSTTSTKSTPRWSAAQLSATERCIMQSLGYRILPLLDADLIADARADMHRAGLQATRAQQRRQGVAAAAAAAAAAAVTGQAAADTELADARRHHGVSRSECLGRFSSY